MKKLIIMAAVFFLAGCTTIDYADTKIQPNDPAGPFLVTTTDGDTVGKPVGLLEVEHTGVVLFGIIPISAGYLSDVKDTFEAQARRSGANAVVNVEFETYRPPFPLCVLWWVSYSRMRGELVFIKDLESKIPGGKIEVHEGN